MNNVLSFPAKPQPEIRDIPAGIGAEVILIITPDHPDHSVTKLKILGAHYWGKSA